MGVLGRWVRLRCCLQDAKPLEVYSVDFMVDSTQLGFLGAYSKQPHSAHSAHCEPIQPIVSPFSPL